MLTTEQAQELIQLPKKVETNGKLEDSIIYGQPLPFQERYTLISPDELDFTFLYVVNQSAKNLFKLSLYLLDDDTRIGLLRVDFSGQHENPQVLTEAVPEIFHPYVGKFFNYNDHHIHYYVEGYRTTLDWAVPLADDPFPVKQITGNMDVIEAFQQFNQIINLQTTFNLSQLKLI